MPLPGHGRPQNRVGLFYVPAVGSDSGAVAIDGTGDVTFAVVTLDALGVETFDSTGAVAFTGPALDGSGTAGSAGVTGTGAETFAGPAFAASGLETFTGTAVEAFAGPALAASGTETFTSTGAVAVGGPALAGGGVETVQGSGAVAFSGPALDGGVPQAVTGTGEVAFGGPALDALGTGGTDAQLGGGRRYVYPPAQPAQEFIGGSGSMRVLGPHLDGVGALALTGTGTMRIAAAAVEGEGGQFIDGSGAFTVVVALEGTGHVLARRRVSVKASSPARSVHGVGNLTLSSSSPLADGAVSHPAPDAIDRAWTALQSEDDELLLIGVIA